jgi:hypothetical protein
VRRRGLLVAGEISTVELLLVASTAPPLFFFLILTLHRQINGQERLIPFWAQFLLKSPYVLMN